MVIRPGRILSLSSTLMPNLAGLDAQGWREGYQSWLVFKDCKLEVIVKVGFVLAYLILSDPICLLSKILGRTADSTSQNISNILTIRPGVLRIVHPNYDFTIIGPAGPVAPKTCQIRSTMSPFFSSMGSAANSPTRNLGPWRSPRHSTWAQRGRMPRFLIVWRLFLFSLGSLGCLTKSRVCNICNICNIM